MSSEDRADRAVAMAKVILLLVAGCIVWLAWTRFWVQFFEGDSEWDCRPWIVDDVPSEIYLCERAD